MLHYIPTDPADLAGKEWLWIERPDGSRFMLMTPGREVAIPDCAVNAVVCQVSERQSASGF